MSGLVGGDTVIGLNQSYTDKNAGTGKLLVVDAGFTVDDGNGGLNYAVSLASSSGGVITPATLIVTPAAFSRAVNADAEALQQTAIIASAGLATIPAGADANGVVRWDADRVLQGARAGRCLIRVRGDGSRLPEWLRRDERIAEVGLACM